MIKKQARERPHIVMGTTTHKRWPWQSFMYLFLNLVNLWLIVLFGFLHSHSFCALLNAGWERILPSQYIAHQEASICFRWHEILCWTHIFAFLSCKSWEAESLVWTRSAHSRSQILTIWADWHCIKVTSIILVLNNELTRRLEGRDIEIWFRFADNGKCLLWYLDKSLGW